MTPWDREDYAKIVKIKENLEVSVYGPAGPDTEECVSAWKMARILHVIEQRLGIDLLAEVDEK